ncbi:exosortase F system-associated protein [Flavobacterium sp. GA093]|uniref:Exosortase F system-associated protein n=1 Tax=Flavobacterium hydrocarbonoxydans TaxID=2683249 RepID=A0A6I4NTD8_9FLAO|nr:exosortase F system-associated protein [Flavobacterium hydrocarbonoxydans]MWB95765.1 exosortase F system-associated protein [Flavobacterium hydrocarbonoxydans]
MLNKLVENKFKILAAIGIIFCFAIIRALEKQLFYDPFLAYFDRDFIHNPLPEYDAFKLFSGVFIRYFLNTVLSLALIYVLFRDLEILKFSVILYLFFLVILLGLFFLILMSFPEKTWLLFYVRRFLIQPIFIMLFIPAFYYQQQNLKK